MKKYTVEELNEILRLHGLWVKRDAAGIKADLSKANLSKANLIGADLRGADLRGADLSWANLIGANLSKADLRKANLSVADLSKADLIGANLIGANLRWANLRWADLSSKIVSMLRIGSRKDMTTYNFDTDEIFCGCFKGTLKEFEAKVKETHKDNPQYLKEYLGAIKYFESLK